MAIPGLKTSEGKPLLKYDARIGRFKIDQREVTSIKMIVDVENAEAGWMMFKEGTSPQFKLVQVTALLNGAEYPATPDPDPNSGWRRGFMVESIIAKEQRVLGIMSDIRTALAEVR